MSDLELIGTVVLMVIVAVSSLGLYVVKHARKRVGLES